MALARALVIDPTILLLDEPLAALDAVTKSKIVDDLRAWNQEHHVPIVYVTHSREEVFALGDRVIVLENGRVIAQGTPHQVMTAPRLETVAQLSGFENIFDATVMAAHEERGTMVCQPPVRRLRLKRLWCGRMWFGVATRNPRRRYPAGFASAGWIERPQHYSWPGGFAGAA